MRTLQHHHLIDGKYLKEDCISALHSKLEWIIKDNVCERVQHLAFSDLRKALEVFEDECVAYDRSKNFVEGENGDLDDDEDEELNEKDALNPRILVCTQRDAVDYAARNYAESINAERRKS
jgi:hypothetical protein